MILQGDLKAISQVSADILMKLDPEVEYVKKYIEEEVQKLLEEGWQLQSEEGGQLQSEREWVKTLKRRNYTLKISFIHGRKGESITGADLAFELKNEKIIFVQSKRVSTNGRIHFNRFQLFKLFELESEISGKVFYILYPWSIPFNLFPKNLVCFYHLIMRKNQQVQERFFHISEVNFVLGSYKSITQNEFINQGMTKEEFRERFWGCEIGGKDIEEDKKREIFYLYTLATNRLVIWLDILKT